MSGTQVSSFAPANALFDLSKVYGAAQQYQQGQQTLGQNEIEMVARAAQGLLSLPTEEARAAAYPQAVQQLRQHGFGKNAPEAYPGEARLRQISLMGTPSTKQAEWNYNTGVNQVGITPTEPGAGAGGGGAGGGGGGEDIYNLPKAQFLQAVAKRESGGDPTILNYVARADPSAIARGATASGKYQMVDSTWRTAATAAGIDVSKYPTARDAPEALQDQAASKLYDMQGTAPWNPKAWGKNWAKTESGRYELQPTGGGQGGGGGGGGPPAPTTTTTTQATPTAPPASPFGAGAFAPPTRTVAAAPETTASAPNVPTNLIPPVNSPQMVAAQAVAARTGKPAPIEGTDGLFALPGGGVSSGPTAGGLGRRAAGDAIIEGAQTAATTLPPQDAVVAAGPAAGGGGTPAPSQEAPASAFGGGAFATPPPNMLAPGAPGAPATAPVQPAPQNVVAPTPAPAAPAAPTAPAPAAPAMPQPPRLPALVDNLTADDRRQLAGMVRESPADFNRARAAMQARNIALQERALADYDRAQAAARAQQSEQRQQAAAAALQEQRRIENERAAAAAVRQEEEAARKRAEAADPIQGTSDTANANRLLLKYVDKILDGSATPAERRLYAEAAQHYLKPQMQWIDDPIDPTKKQMVQAPGQLPEGFPHPSFKPGEQPEQKPPAVTKTDFKPLPETERKQLIDTATRIDQETQQRNTFKPEYAGDGNAAIGEFRNAVARNNPFASKGETARAEWWQNYQRYKLSVRQGISGQSLTASELGEFDKADIHPGMTAQAVRDNLLQQDKILRTAHERRVGSLAADKYSPDAIRSASGVDPAKVTARPLTEGNAPKPDAAPHPPGFTVVIP